jgi:N-acetylmuramoyl-L-alanine amidase
MEWSMSSIHWAPPLAIAVFFSLQCRQIGPPDGGPDAWRAPAPRSGGLMPVSTGAPPARVSAPVSAPGISPAAFLREINLKVDMVPKGTHGRKVVRPMTPRYITIHSTQNFTAGAERHSLALKRGALRAPKRPGGNRIGYLIWHFTVDDGVAIQHMPTSEQGEHADFDGPGNRYSIGIEMCEHRGCDREKTLERTAKLTAHQMVRHHIPLRNVVPHYHWPRKGQKVPNKNCPHFLLNNGKPGPKWRAFLARVDHHHKRLTGSPQPVSHHVASR